ncbi:MAG: phosphoribosylanthranilate isomerase [Halofilum sp. (in: g-proteobacteria)]|nr:phosphoribosylanthranilate isomerase [Halofilum sp. (in: g-proteobacteria)]
MGCTRIKICGIARAGDARAAAAHGADAIGLVFYPPSSRAVEIEQARALIAELPPFVTPVGLFLDPEPGWVERVIEGAPVELLQFHGREDAAFCRRFGRPYIKAARHGRRDRWHGHGARPTRTPAGCWSTATRPGSAGGTGEGFAWERIPRKRDFPLVLAGGLRPDNVAAAMAVVRPEAVDVSSGVERARGVKDEALIREFIEEVRRGDRNQG